VESVGLILDLALLGTALSYFPGSFLSIGLAQDQNRHAKSGLKRSVERLDVMAIDQCSVERRGCNSAAAKPPDPAWKFGSPFVVLFRARLFRGSRF
jgi:hypothetical protein